jgi:hypothetical protein
LYECPRYHENIKVTMLDQVLCILSQTQDVSDLTVKMFRHGRNQSQDLEYYDTRDYHRE